jgi:hypothetical protein
MSGQSQPRQDQHGLARVYSKKGADMRDRSSLCASQDGALLFAAQSRARPLDAIENREQARIFLEPALQQAPLSQQDLVRGSIEVSPASLATSVDSSRCSTS